MKPKPKKPAAPASRKVLIVDDHPLMRDGLVALINAQPDLAVCAQAADAREALHAVETLQTHLVLMDLSLPGRGGLEVIKDIVALAPGLPILVLSMHDESLYAERVLRAGARGYVMKQEGGQRILQGIRAVLDGKTFVSEAMAARIMDAFTGRRAGDSVTTLTDREFEVFQLIGHGRSTREIATQLHLSVKTVEVHRVNIKAKLKLTTSSELIHHAVRWVESQPSNHT